MTEMKGHEMTNLLLPILDVSKKRFISGLVLLYLYSVLPTASAADALSRLCTTLDGAGGSIKLYEGQSNNVTIYTRNTTCDSPACIAANTSCSAFCNGCGGFEGAVNMKLTGQRVGGSAIPGFVCSIANETTRQQHLRLGQDATEDNAGFWQATCLPTNSLAGQSGYSLVLTVMNGDNTISFTKSASIKFIAGDVVVQNCLGSLESGSDKAYLGSNNVLQIWLKDTWNNTVVGSEIAPIPFTVTVTWNPDNGIYVSLRQSPTVDTSGNNGFYTASINPTKTGNYLAKIGVNDTMVLNSPIAFQAIEGKRGSASFLRPSFLGSAMWCLCLSVIYMAGRCDLALGYHARGETAS